MVVRLLAALAIAMACTAAAGATAQRFIPLLEAGDAIPPIPLVAQDGRPFTLADLHGKAVAVSFVYTRCRDPGMCPLVAAKFARMQHDIGVAPIHLVILTLDPKHDSAPVLARYGRVFGQDPRYWTLATGSPAMIDELVERLGVVASATATGALIHSVAVVVIGPDGRIARTIAGNDWNTSDVIDYTRATLSVNHNPFISARAWLSSAIESCGGAAVALGGTAMLSILAIATASIGAAMWHAFREKTINEKTINR